MASGTVTVGVASAQLAPAQLRPGPLLVQNLSAADIWIDFGRPAVAGQSLHIPPSPAPPIILDGAAFYADLSRPIYGIASAAGSKLYYILSSPG